MNKATVRLALVSVIIILCMLLAFPGCSKPQPVSPQPVAPSPAAPAPSAPTPPPAPEGPKSGGTLRIAKVEDALVLGNPSTMFRQSCSTFAAPAIEKLVYFDAAGDPVPGLAESWKIDAANNTITLNLRKGVKFHDGTDFNAEAVKWNFEQFTAQKRSELLRIQSVEMPDPHTMVLKLSEMDNMLMLNLANVSGMIISPTAYEKNGEDWAVANPVGTGPFKFVEWKRDERIVFEKFDGYWQEGKPYLDRIEFEIIADPMVMKAAFQKGEVDVIIELTEKVAKELETIADYRITKTGLPMRLFGLYPDSKNDGPYADVRVRQAVWHAIDRAAVCHAVGLGYWEPLNQAAVKDSWVYNPNVKGYPYDPAKAKQLLAEAGYANGFKTTIYCLNLPPLPDTATIYQAFLKDVGIDAQIEIVDKGRFDTMVAGGGGWQDGLTILWNSVVPNELTLQQRLMSKAVSAARLPSVFFPDDYQSLLDEVIFAPDYETMKRRTPALMEMMTDKYALVPYMYATTGIAARYNYVKDDGLYETLFSQWSPEKAWLDK